MPWKLHGNVGSGGGGHKPLMEGLDPPPPAPSLATGLDDSCNRSPVITNLAYTETSLRYIVPKLDMGRVHPWVGLGHKILRLKWVGLGRVQCQNI